MAKRCIADTGFLFALFDRNDAHHAWAIQVSRQQDIFYTCEAVIGEASYLLRKHMGTESLTDFLFAVESNLLVIDFHIEQHIKRVRELLRKYEKIMDYADACIVAMTEQEAYRDCEVLTVDRNDFTVYRRHGRNLIPIQTPAT